MQPKVIALVIVGSLTVANGEVYDIVQHMTTDRFTVVHKHGFVRNELCHSKDIEACWRHIRFASRIGQQTEHSPHVEWAPSP